MYPHDSILPTFGNYWLMGTVFYIEWKHSQDQHAIPFACFDHETSRPFAHLYRIVLRQWRTPHVALCRLWTWLHPPSDSRKHGYRFFVQLSVHLIINQSELLNQGVPVSYLRNLQKFVSQTVEQATGSARNQMTSKIVFSCDLAAGSSQNRVRKLYSKT